MRGSALLLLPLLLIFVPPVFADEAVIRPDDTLLVRVSIPESGISNFYRVDDAGAIQLLFVGKIKVAGLNCADAARTIDDSYLAQKVTFHRTAFVSIGGPAPFVVLEGEVTHPGRVAIRPGLTLLQAISEAGGFTSSANRDAVKLKRVTSAAVTLCNVARIIHDPRLDIALLGGDEIRIEAKKE